MPSADKSDVTKILILETDLQPKEDASAGDLGKAFHNLFGRISENLSPPTRIEIKSHYVVGPESDEKSPNPKGGSLPDIDILSDYSGILLTGSRHDAHGDAEWIQNLLKWLEEAWKKYPKLRFSGVCFGHQTICRLLGGKVDSHPTTWEISHTVIKLTDTGKGLFEVDGDELALHQMHQDYVHTPPSVESSRGLLPKSAQVKVWGSTKDCPIQGVYVQGRVFTTQGHLEEGEALVGEAMEEAKKNGLGEGEEDVWEAEKQLELEHDGDVVATAVLRFLAGRDDELE